MSVQEVVFDNKCNMDTDVEGNSGDVFVGVGYVENISTTPPYVDVACVKNNSQGQCSGDQSPPIETFEQFIAHLSPWMRNKRHKPGSGSRKRLPRKVTRKLTDARVRRKRKKDQQFRELVVAQGRRAEANYQRLVNNSSSSSHE